MNAEPSESAPSVENPLGELSAASDRAAAERRRRWRRSPLGIACMVAAVIAAIALQQINIDDGKNSWFGWLAALLLILFGIYGLTRSGAQKEAQSGRIQNGYGGISAAKTVRGARLASGVLVVFGVVCLVLVATVGF